MLKQIICIIVVINLLNSFANGLPNSKSNTTDELKMLREDLEQQRMLIEELVEKSYPRNCAESRYNGIQDIMIPNFSSNPVKVDCDSDGWTVILRRFDGSENFNRNWKDYKNGFGNMEGEFFLGLEKIHALTAERSQQLAIQLDDFEGKETLQMYSEFAIGNEDEQYALHTLGESSGDAGDSLKYHRGMSFTTFDRDNDLRSNGNCADSSSGGWWYANCTVSNLAGAYNDNRFDKGIIWKTFRGKNYSLKQAVMLIRP
ncbi:angiopoietin-related protein 2-like [Drosophila innubila]|uniref:angiopoietin-related protein 2-like n=1 Tax=Drosophila innubila TaxID=198719 RepID=UPI00148D5045|nr:angiopoietin-related protein 2-like [Drosophila innubila]